MSSNTSTLNGTTQPPSSPKSISYKSAPSTTNNKLNHNVASNSESKGSKINCQMNNLLEEDEDDDMEGEKIDSAGDKKEIKANGAHLSVEQIQNSSTLAKEPPQNLLINCLSGLKTETCI